MEVNGTIFVQIFIFLTLLLWLSPTLFAPILRLFDERDRRIFGARDDAKKMTLLAEEKAATFDLEYKKAQMSARETLTELKKQTDGELAIALENVRVRARQRLDLAQVELLAQEEQARKELHQSSELIAHDIVGALLSVKVKSGMKNGIKNEINNEEGILA